MFIRAHFPVDVPQCVRVDTPGRFQPLQWFPVLACIAPTLPAATDPATVEKILIKGENENHYQAHPRGLPSRE